MAEIPVKVVKIKEVKEHTNADKLELAIVGGWQVCVKKDQFKAGDEAIYIPPDVVIPQEVSDNWGVTDYLSKGRVKAVRLRGEPSYGFLVENKDNDPLGVDLKDKFGIEKWEPPQEFSGGLMETPHPLFHTYTDIQNIRNEEYQVLEDGEEVIASEKIHGTNSRIGYIKTENGMQLMVGSRTTRRKLNNNDMYEFPMMEYGEEIQKLFDILNDEEVESIILFGEIYGKVQDLRYGLGADFDYRAFDLAINGEYIDYDDFVKYMEEVGIPTAPFIYRGPFNMETLKNCAEGNTCLMEDSPHIREGVVVKPATERTDPKLGRVILKYISDDYLTRKGGTENH
jgi:RNA ligase (TIGR02306 family)